MKVVAGLYYTKEHEWIKVEGGEAYIGITDFAQHAMGDVVYVELPEVDDSFDEGEVFGVIESVKAASDIFMPVGGTITKTNEALEDESGLLNQEPYANWIICVEMQDQDQLSELMSAEQYQNFCSELE